MLNYVAKKGASSAQRLGIVGTTLSLAVKMIEVIITTTITIAVTVANHC